MPPLLARHRTLARITLGALAALAFACARPLPALALWSANPTTGTPVCLADGDQWPLGAVSDGAGGLIVAWIDGRGGVTANGLYAQRLDVFGRTAWTTDGVAVVANTVVAQSIGVAPDGAGGVLLAWSESRLGAPAAVYAQRLDGNGAARWGTGGVRVSVSPTAQSTPVVCGDGAGGALVAWMAAGTDSEIVVRRLGANGVPQWAASGVTLSALGVRDVRPRIACDGARGAVVAWTSGSGLAAQRVDSTGTPRWPARYQRSGVLLTDLQADGAGGVFVAWTRGYMVANTPQQDAMVQRLASDGSESWAVGGLKLDTSNNVYKIQLAGDGSGGVFAAWEHATATSSLVRAQHVATGGIAAWSSGGVTVCPAGAGQAAPHVVSDAAGGMIVVFEDSRSTVRLDAYAQRLAPAGTLMWGAGGAPVCTAAGSGVGEALLVPGINSGAIAVWDDFRTLFYESDLYATRLLATGAMGPTAVGAPVRPAGSLALAPPYPQPARGQVTLRYRGASAAVGRIELFDLAGRRARAMEVGLAAGAEGALRLSLTDESGLALPAGSYTARLSVAGDVASVPLVVIR